MAFNYITKNLTLAEDDAHKLRYSLRMIIGDSSKLILLFILFWALNCQTAYVMSVAVLSLIRMFTGGLHFKTYSGCLLFSTLFFSACIYLANFYPVSRIGLLSIGAVSILGIVMFSPVTSKNRPNYSPAKRLQFRIIGSTVAMLHLISFMATKNNPYFTIAVWVIFLQAIQLMIAKGVEYREKELSI